MDSLTKKTHTTARSYTYTYYTSPSKGDLPTLLLIHGWPDSAGLWSSFISDHLQPSGYGVVVIDCLGYAGTSKPTDPQAYNFQGLTGDLVEILDAENIPKAIPLGHDWGCVLAQRFYNFYPDRTAGLVMVNVAYIPPPGDVPFNLAAMQDATTRMFGYGAYWYWKLFGAPDGAEILNNHLESLWTILHGEPSTWRETFCTEDGMRDFLLADARQPTEPYATAAMRESFVQRMSRDKFDAPQQWYRATVQGVQRASHTAIAPENRTVHVPTLFVAAGRDAVCRPELIGMGVQAGLLPQLETVTLDAGHWSMLAQPKQFGDAVVRWLEEKF